MCPGNSLSVQWLRLYASSTAEAYVWSLVRGLRFHKPRSAAKKKKKERKKERIKQDVSYSQLWQRNWSNLRPWVSGLLVSPTIWSQKDPSLKVFYRTIEKVPFSLYEMVFYSGHYLEWLYFVAQDLLFYKLWVLTHINNKLKQLNKVAPKYWESRRYRKTCASRDHLKPR